MFSLEHGAEHPPVLVLFEKVVSAKAIFIYL
jgi:hypothetical protein